MKTVESAVWFCEKIEAIRAAAGHDAEKLEALSLAPELVAEVAERFPDDPILVAQVRTAIELELPLARVGIFLLDGPPTDEQIAELQRRDGSG